MKGNNTPAFFSDEAMQRIEKAAARRGYEAPADYLLALVDADLAADVDEFIDPDARQLEESFRIAWGQAMRGETITIEELRRSVENDD